MKVTVNNLVEEETAIDFMMADPGNAQAQLSELLQNQGFGPSSADAGGKGSRLWPKRIVTGTRSWSLDVYWYPENADSFSLYLEVRDRDRKKFVYGSTALRPIADLPDVLATVHSMVSTHSEAPLETVVRDLKDKRIWASTTY